MLVMFSLNVHKEDLMFQSKDSCAVIFKLRDMNFF